MLGALETWYRSSDLRTVQTVRKTHIYFIWMTVLQSAHGIINPGTWHKAESSFTPTSIQVISNDLHPQVSSCKKAQPMHDSNDISGKKKVSWKISHHSNKRTFQTPPDPCRNKLVTCEIWLVGSYSCPACYISFEGLYWSGIIGPPVLLPIHTRNPANKIQHATVSKDFLLLVLHQASVNCLSPTLYSAALTLLRTTEEAANCERSESGAAPWFRREAAYSRLNSASSAAGKSLVMLNSLQFRATRGQ